MTTLTGPIVDHELAPTCPWWRLPVARPGLALMLILLMAGLLRFRGLDREGQWGDEYLQTMQYDQSPWYVVLGGRTNNQPPLDFLIGWAVTKLSQSTWMVRAPAAAFGVLSVGALFLLVRRLFGSGTALLAAALLAVAPLHFKLSQEARPYTIYVCGMLLTLWAMLRALERPTWSRVGCYAGCACLLTLTRGLDPQILALCCGVVVSILWLRAPGERQGAGRVWLATLAAGVAGAGVLAFLVRGDTGWTVFGVEGGQQTSGLLRFVASLVQNAQIWWSAPDALFGRGALPMLVLAVLGVAWCMLCWRHWSQPVRCVLVVLWLCGPTYLLVYSATVPKNPICDRYAMFLTPVVAAFAAAMLVELLRRSFSAQGNTWMRAAGVFIAVALVVLPAASSLALAQQYFNPDWQGSAASLGPRYGGNDVILVFTDRALAAHQSPYWGKLEWPTKDRPLGESMWTLGTSEAHWRRLVRSTGRCCLVIKHTPEPQARDEFYQRGLLAAPSGLHLEKFRNLDVLEGFAGDDLPTQVVAACDTVLALPQANADARAIAFLLRSRVELLRGEVEKSRASLAAAVECVPEELQAWFARLTQVHRAALGEAEQAAARPGAR